MLNKLAFILTNPEKKQLIILIFGSLVLAVSETISIGIVIPIMSLFIDQKKIHTSVLSHIYQFLRFENTNSFLIFLIIVAIIIFALRALFSVLTVYFQQNSIGKIYIRLTTDVLEAYLEKPYSFHLLSNSSELFKNVSLEVSQFIMGFLTPIILISSEFIVLLVIFLFLIFVFPLSTLMLVAVFGIIVCSTHNLFKKRIKLYSTKREIYSGLMYKNALESFHAVKEIKVFDAQSFFTRRFAEAVKTYINSFVKFSVVSVLPRYMFETVLISTMLLLVLSGVLLHKAFAELIPMLTVFVVAAIRLVPSFSKIYSNINLFHYSQNSLDIVYGILKERGGKEIQASLIHDKLSRFKKDSMDLQDITFCYESVSVPIFENLSIAIPLQQMVAIAGLTGSGKSTLINILMGLLIPAKGNLYYRGLIINQNNMIEYRRKIGYVSQNFCIIDDTISSNIAFGITENQIDPERLGEVIKIAQLEAFINDLPQGLNTQVGERGVRISGGQKQRIGIARALYRNPEILILDEATSALDRHTESKLYAAIRNSNKELTIIIVTHRVNTLEHPDYIYVIDSGKIVDQGSPKALLENSEVFRKIIHQVAHLVNEISEDS